MRCSKAEKIRIITCVGSLILTVHFYKDKIPSFWYNCGLHGGKNNHLLRNLFFYASAVNVHIVAVWCSMVKKQSVSVIVGGDYSGKNGLPEIFHLSIHLTFHSEEAKTNLVPTEERMPSSHWIEKGILPWRKHCLIHWSTDLIFGKLLSSPHVKGKSLYIHCHSRKRIMFVLCFLTNLSFKRWKIKIFKSQVWPFYFFKKYKIVNYVFTAQTKCNILKLNTFVETHLSIRKLWMPVLWAERISGRWSDHDRWRRFNFLLWIHDAPFLTSLGFGAVSWVLSFFFRC